MQTIHQQTDIRDSNLTHIRLKEVVLQKLTDSSFFSQLVKQELDIKQVRKVFGQYYLWRNSFHSWFGVCITKSPAFGTDFELNSVLTELAEHILQEVKEDHHGLCMEFLEELGVTTKHISLSPVTKEYINSFSQEFLLQNRTFHEAMAALAGRELTAPYRNQLIINSLPYYGVNESLFFFKLHEDLESQHFQGLWNALAKNSSDLQLTNLLDSAINAINKHITFWDHSLLWSDE